MIPTSTIRRSIVLLQTEAVVTGMIFAMPVINLFFASEIGMSPLQIGLSQAAFTAALLVLNVPAGWLADRFSRRASNIAGDVIASVGFMLYAVANTFTDVVICEVIIGVGLAFSTGADTGLFKSYADALHISYTTISARVQELRPFGEAGGYIVGSLVGGTHPRLAIGLSAVSCAIGAVLSYYTVEVGERRVSEHHPLKDMVVIVNQTMRGTKHLVWNILALALSRNMTHAIIWVFTPLLVLAGVPVYILGIAWALNTAMVYCGARMARQWANAMSDWQQFVVALPVFLLASGVLAMHVSLATVWLYGLYGWCRGWMGSVMGPIVQKHTAADVRSTVDSVADSLGRIVYIPAVSLIGLAASHNPQLAVSVNMLVFAPLLALNGYRLFRLK